MATKYAPIPNSHEKVLKICFQRSSIMYQNWGFGLKMNHLATLMGEPFNLRPLNKKQVGRYIPSCHGFTLCRFGLKMLILDTHEKVLLILAFRKLH
jgi:hypothetical protein